MEDYVVIYAIVPKYIFEKKLTPEDESFDKITLIQEAKDGLIILIESYTYSIITNIYSEFIKFFYLKNNVIGI